MESKQRRKHPVAFLVVARDERSGREEVFRTARIQGMEGKVADAIATGKVFEGCRWKRVPVRYRVVLRATGQELMCRYDPDRHLYVTDGGVEFTVRQFRSCEEVVCSE